MYEARTYRQVHTNNALDSFEVNFLETDVWIGIDKGSYIHEMRNFVINKIVELRTLLIGYNTSNHKFFHSLEPLSINEDAPEIIKTMLYAGKKTKTGPMSSVAGVFAKYIADALVSNYNLKNVIVENGGDNYLYLNDLEVEIPIFAGDSPVSNQLGLKIKANDTPLGICTSSGKIGHSHSFGNANAVTVVSKDIALADAYATSICNTIIEEEDVGDAISRIEHYPEIESCIIIMNKSVGIKGEHEVVFLK